MKIVYKRLDGQARQILKIDKNKMIASQMNASGSIRESGRYNLDEGARASRVIFDKIAKHGVEMCLLCEIIQDNVLKR